MLTELLGSTDFVDECVHDILDRNDELLARAIQAVAARLPKSAFNDLEWCKAVIDVTVEEVLASFDVDLFVKDSVQAVSEKLISRVRPPVKPRYSTSEPDQNIMSRKKNSVKMPPSPPIVQGKFSSPPRFLPDSTRDDSYENNEFDDSCSSDLEAQREEISVDSLEHESSSSAKKKVARNVKFNESPVSNTREYEKFSKEEAEGLFYSHEDALKFQMDFERETMKASRAGKSWIEWINTAPEDELDCSGSDDAYLGSDGFSDDELDFNRENTFQDETDRDNLSGDQW